MKHILSVILLQFVTVLAFSQYKVTDEGSSVKFKIKNFGLETGGSFSGLQGTITFDPNDLKTAKIDLSVDASSVNTDNNMRDNHLRDEGYLDVKQYPRIKFVSGGITVDNNAHFTATGHITIKGTTKEIAIPFTITPKDGGYVFVGEFKLNRKDFKVGGGSTISNGLTVQFSLLAAK